MDTAAAITKEAKKETACLLLCETQASASERRKREIKRDKEKERHRKRQPSKALEWHRQ